MQNMTSVARMTQFFSYAAGLYFNTSKVVWKALWYIFIRAGNSAITDDSINKYLSENHYRGAEQHKYLQHMSLRLPTPEFVFRIGSCLVQELKHRSTARQDVYY